MTTQGDIERWLESHAEWSLGTRAGYRSFICVFFRWAVDSGLTDTNPLDEGRRTYGLAWTRFLARTGTTDADPAMLPTLDDLSIAYVTARLARGDMAVETAKRTIRVLDDFARFLGDRPVSGISAELGVAWINSGGRKVANTRRTDLARLKPFFAWLTRRGHLAIDPGPDIPVIKVPRLLPRYIHRSDVAALLRVCPDGRARFIVLCQAQLAMRCCEVAAMQVTDVSMDERSLRVRGKGGHQRLLPIDDETWSALGAYLSEHPADAGPIVRVYGFSGRALSPAVISQLVVKWMYAAKIKQRPRDGVTAHALRHTACVDMLRNGAHLRDVQTAMGHASILTTQWYMPMVVQGLRRAMGGRRYGDLSPEDLLPNASQLVLPGFPSPGETSDTLLNGPIPNPGDVRGETRVECWKPEPYRQVAPKRH